MTNENTTVPVRESDSASKINWKNYGFFGVGAALAALLMGSFLILFLDHERPPKDFLHHSITNNLSPLANFTEDNNSKPPPKEAKTKPNRFIGFERHHPPPPPKFRNHQASALFLPSISNRVVIEKDNNQDFNDDFAYFENAKISFFKKSFTLVSSGLKSILNSIRIDYSTLIRGP